MNGEDVRSWIDKKGLRPEEAAAIFKISLSTLQNGLRGARWGFETVSKIREAMQKHDSAEIKDNTGPIKPNAA